MPDSPKNMRLVFGLLVAVALLAALPARAADWPDLSRLAIHLDNDEFTGNRPDDRWYSSGGRIDWLNTNPSPAPLATVSCANLPASLLHRSARRFNSFGQDIYSQNPRLNTTPDPDDRPVSALLYLQSGRSAIGQTINGTSSHAMAKLEIGVTGPAALGEPVQNGLHDLLGVDRVRIWGNQVRPRLGINLHLACTVQLARVRQDSRSPLVLNARYELSLGNLLTQAGVSVALAAGPDARRINIPRPARLASPVVRPIRRWAAIAGVSIRAVAYDVSIDGDTYGYRSRVSTRPLQGDAFVGLTAGVTRRWQLSYALMWRSMDFEGPGVEAQNFERQLIGQLVLQAPLQ